jgi:hypothetical protein
MADLNLVFGILSIIGSIITVYLSYTIYTYNRISKGWLAVIVAFVLIICRRSIGFVTDSGFFPEFKTLMKSIEGLLLLIISLLYIWGFWSMKKNFERFDIVEKKTIQVANALKEKAQKKKKN